MNSMALWYDKELKVELDVNIFISDERYIEFGLKCITKEHDDDKIYKLFIYMPYTMAKQDIKNINLSKDIELIRAMFNEDINITISKYTKIGYKSPHNYTKEFYIRNLYDYSVEHKAQGSILSIEVRDTIKDPCGYYYRFRVNRLGAFINEYSDNIAIVDWMFKKSEHVDFVINKSDKLPDMIVDRMKHFKAEIYRVNFFLITKDRYNMLSSNVPHHNIKTASSIWIRHYKESAKELIIYHFKEINVFVKFQSIRYSRILAFAVIFIALMTLLANYIAISKWLQQ